MSYTLKLDIYYFSLKKIKEETIRRFQGKDVTIHTTEKEDCLFDDFVKSLSSDEGDNNNYTETFLKDFITGFNNAFKPNKSNTQAMSITTDLFKKYNSKDHTVSGVFKGGPTGTEFEIYALTNASEPTGVITEDNITSLSYFYKIWIPTDSNVGVLMVQSYTHMGCTGMFKEQLSNYFIDKGYKASWSKHIPNDYIEQYFKEGYINAIQVLYRNREDDKPLNPVFGPIIAARRKSVFSGFKIPFKEFISIPDYRKMLKSQIQAIDTEYDEKKDEIKLFYIDAEGKKAHAKLAEIENILPTIVLDDSLKEANSHIPKWEDLNDFTNGILDDIKKQISYTPHLI